MIFFYINWKKITSDQNILDIVKHCHIDFVDGRPFQKVLPHQRKFNKFEEDIVSNDIDKKLKMDVIREVDTEHNQFISPIFTVPKKTFERTQNDFKFKRVKSTYQILSF